MYSDYDLKTFKMVKSCVAGSKTGWFLSALLR
jgi:hypothetical protein